MNPCTRSILSLWILLGACEPGEVVVGASVPEPEGEPGASTSSADPTTSVSVSSTTMSSGVLAYGEVCEMFKDGAPFVPHSKVVQASDACADGICVYPSDGTLAPCDGPEDCAGVPWQTGSCSEFGACNLDLGWVAGRSLCTRTCEVEADCPDADSCPGGFACQPVHKLEPYCCEKLCVCKDDVDAASADDLAQACAGPGNGC